MVWAYLIVSTCQIVLYSPADEMAARDEGGKIDLMPRPWAVIDFRDREVCDFLAAQGVATIYVDRKTPPEDVPDLHPEGGDLNITK